MLGRLWRNPFCAATVSTTSPIALALPPKGLAQQTAVLRFLIPAFCYFLRQCPLVLTLFQLHVPSYLSSPLSFPLCSGSHPFLPAPLSDSANSRNTRFCVRSQLC